MSLNQWCVMWAYLIIAFSCRVICGHPQGRRTEFSLVASGNGGIDEFSTHLDDNHVMYGLGEK